MNQFLSRRVLSKVGLVLALLVIGGGWGRAAALYYRTPQARFRLRLAPIPATAEVAPRLLQRYDGQDYQLVYQTPAGHFEIWYNASGYGVPYSLDDADGNGQVDYIERLGEFLDYVWTKEVTDLGYQAPPGTDVRRYRVWLEPMADMYGYTVGLAGADLPQGYSEIAINSQLPPSENYRDLKLTIAHEFFHAIQFGYDLNEPRWWMEGSSVWMEEQIYDSFNGYDDYIGQFFSAPETGFEMPGNQPSADLREYSAFLLVQYIGETQHRIRVQKIWEFLQGYRDVLDAMDLMPVTAAGNFRGFTTWAYTREYEEAARMPQLNFNRTLTHYPAGESPATRLPASLGTNYIRFLPPVSGAEQTLIVEFQGEPDSQWIATLAGRGSAGNTVIPYSLTRNASGESGVARLSGFGTTYEEACLIVTPMVSGYIDFLYRYDARLEEVAPAGESSGKDTDASDSSPPTEEDASSGNDDTGTTGSTGGTGDVTIPGESDESPADGSGETAVANAYLRLNRAVYSAGDPLTLFLSVSGTGRYDVYILIATPDGGVFSLTAPSQLGPPNAVLPIVRDWEVQSVDAAPVLQVPALPVLPTGTYACSVILVAPDDAPQGVLATRQHTTSFTLF